jgi:hypothetical protein
VQISVKIVFGTARRRSQGRSPSSEDRLCLALIVAAWKGFSGVNGGIDPIRAQDLPDRGRGDLQPRVGSSRAPAGIPTTGSSSRGAASTRGSNGRCAGVPAVGPLRCRVTAGMQITMPAQHSVGPHRAEILQHRPGQPAEQRGQPVPVGGLEPDPLPAELAVQHGELGGAGRGSPRPYPGRCAAVAAAMRTRSCTPAPTNQDRPRLPENTLTSTDVLFGRYTLHLGAGHPAQDRLQDLVIAGDRLETAEHLGHDLVGYVVPQPEQRRYHRHGSGNTCGHPTGGFSHSSPMISRTRSIRPASWSVWSPVVPHSAAQWSGDDGHCVTYTLTGKPVTDVEALAQMDLPAHEACVEVGPAHRAAGEATARPGVRRHLPDSRDVDARDDGFVALGGCKFETSLISHAFVELLDHDLMGMGRKIRDGAEEIPRQAASVRCVVSRVATVPAAMNAGCRKPTQYCAS